MKKRLFIILLIMVCCYGIFLYKTKMNCAPETLKNLAHGKSYISSRSADGDYPDLGKRELTDGKYDKTGDYGNPAWQGRLLSGSYSQTIDLGEPFSVREVSSNFLHNKVCGIKYPVKVTYYASNDRVNFTKINTPNVINGESNIRKYKVDCSISARYIKMSVKCDENWVFCDEMEVMGNDSIEPAKSDSPKTSPKPDNTDNGPIVSPKPDNTDNGPIVSPKPDNNDNGPIVSPKPDDNSNNKMNILYGVTVDESYSSIQEVVSALKALSVKPTVRIVFGKDVPARDYVELTTAIHKVAYVLGCVYDSTAENGVSLSRHHARWVDYVTTLGSNVDIWEVGNEVNGEGWLGDDKQLLADKFYDAYKYCKSRGVKTELTPYQFKPGDQSMTMNDWLQRYIPKDMKDGLDYVLVSYYDDDNDGYKWDWNIVMDDMHKMFPNSKVGIGECGFPSPHSAGGAFNKRVDQYYKMPKFNESYVGGYFWWNWAEDCVPHTNNSRWTQINDDFKWMSENLK